MCDCNKTTNISMGCCQPVLGPIEAYYTKFTIDRKLEEITSAITSGCCITPEEVDEKIASAKTEIEGEIPTVPTNVSAFNNDAGYLTQHQSLSAYSTTQEMNTAISQATSDKVDTSTYTAYTASTQTTINNKADSSILNNYMLKSQIWCGNYTEWGQISGSTDPNVIYLIHN